MNDKVLPHNKRKTNQRKVWNMRVFRLLLWGKFLIGSLATFHVSESLPGLESGNDEVVPAFPQRLQQLEEYRRDTSTLTMY